jgi:hypothetical protein
MSEGVLESRNLSIQVALKTLIRLSLCDYMFLTKRRDSLRITRVIPGYTIICH